MLACKGSRGSYTLNGSDASFERRCLRCGQVRDLYWTVRNFRQRVLDFLRYRRVTANLDERFQVHAQRVPAVCMRSKHHGKCGACKALHVER